MWIARAIGILSRCLIGPGFFALSAKARTIGQSRVILVLDLLSCMSGQIKGGDNVVIAMIAPKNSRATLHVLPEPPVSVATQNLELFISRIFYIGSNAIFIFRLAPSPIEQFGLKVSQTEDVYFVAEDACRKKQDLYACCCADRAA